jgi:hypothetical protein
MKLATLIASILIFSNANGQDIFAVQRELKKNLADDKSTKNEIDRIHGLGTAASQALLTRQLDDAQHAIDMYTNYLSSDKPLKERVDGLQTQRQEAAKNVETLVTIGKKCKDTKTFDVLDTTLISLRTFYSSIGLDSTFGLIGVPSVSGNPNDVEVLTKVSKYVSMDGRDFCKYVIDNEIDMGKLKDNMLKSNRSRCGPPKNHWAILVRPARYPNQPRFSSS